MKNVSNYAGLFFSLLPGADGDTVGTLFFSLLLTSSILLCSPRPLFVGSRGKIVSASILSQPAIVFTGC